MINNNCSLCGMICYEGKDICETCSEFSADTSVNAAPQEENQTEYFSAQNTNTYDNSYQGQASNYQPQTNNYQNQANNNYSGANQSYGNYSPPPPRQEFKSQAKDGSLQFLWDLSPIAKGIIGFVILSIGFAFVLRAFMSMDLTPVQVSSENRQTLENAEEIVPWFSGWIRSYPTGEEIFDKFEQVTYAEGNKTVSETFQFTGSGIFLSPHFSEAKWAKALKDRKIKNRDEFNKVYFDELPAKPVNYDFSGSKTKLWDFEMSFNVILKKPNKTVFSMNLSYRNKEYKIPELKIVAGNDGEKPWAVSSGPKTHGNHKITNKDKYNLGFAGNPQGISMSFPKSMFEKIEFKGEESILGRKQYKVEVADADKTQEIYFDQETGLATKTVNQDVTIYIVNYSLFKDSLYPSKFAYIPANGKPPLLMEIKSLEMGLPFEDKLFLETTYNQD